MRACENERGTLNGRNFFCSAVRVYDPIENTPLRTRRLLIDPVHWRNVEARLFLRQT